MDSLLLMQPKPAAAANRTASMQRFDWSELPLSVRQAVEDRSGPVVKAEGTTEGLNSHLAVLLYTASGSLFLKGVRTDHPNVAAQQREALINPYVRSVTPALLWKAEAHGWNLLAFEAVEGRHADYALGSSDLPKVVEALHKLSQIKAPDIGLRAAESRWAEYVDSPTQLELLAGDSLLHTDISPYNILITRGPARIIDWAWPTKGAAFIDPCYFAIRLMAAGHTPERAETWAARVPVWRDASKEAVDCFVAISARMWGEIADSAPHDRWKQRMGAVATAWSSYRS
jgi:hypothetical protein